VRRSAAFLWVAVFSESSLVTAPERLASSLDRGVAKGKLTEPERDAALDRVSFTRDFADLADRHLVIEAVTEDEQLKRDLYATLDKIVEDPDAILATNTSSIPVVRLAAATRRPGQVLGLHFFNPVPALPLVELVSSVLTDEAVSARALVFARDILGKKPIASPDRADFLVDALLFAVPAVRGPHDRVGPGDGRGPLPGYDAGLLAPDGTATARRPHRPGHHRLHRPGRTRSSRSRCTRPRRCCCAWSRAACRARSPAAASTPALDILPAQRLGIPACSRTSRVGRSGWVLLHRAVRHGCPSFLRSTGCYRQSGGLGDIDRRVDVPVQDRPARPARPAVQIRTWRGLGPSLTPDPEHTWEVG
jgi:hypothetical protein